MEIKKSTEAPEANGLSTVGDGALPDVVDKPAEQVQILLSDNTILDIELPDIEKTIAMSEGKNGIAFGSLLAHCIIPIKHKVFSVVSSLLNTIVAACNNREEMAPRELVKAKREVLTLQSQIGSISACLLSARGEVEQYTYDGIQQSDALVETFLKAVRNFCAGMQEVDNQYSTDKSYYRRQTLGVTKPEFDPQVIFAFVQRFIQEMNILISGENGWKIAAIANNISKISNLLSNTKIMEQLGSRNKMEMLNKLGYRIDPLEISFHKSLVKLVEMIGAIYKSEDVSNNDAVALLIACQAVNSRLAKYLKSA